MPFGRSLGLQEDSYGNGILRKTREVFMTLILRHKASQHFKLFKEIIRIEGLKDYLMD